MLELLRKERFLYRRLYGRFRVIRGLYGNLGGKFMNFRIGGSGSSVQMKVQNNKKSLTNKNKILSHKTFNSKQKLKN